jgi:hypothetical protein
MNTRSDAGGEDSIFSLPAERDCHDSSSQVAAPLQILQILVSAGDPHNTAADREGDQSLSISVLSAAIQLADLAAASIAGSPALPEILQPVSTALDALGSVRGLNPVRVTWCT